jgi:hypothetical protein
MVTLEQLAAPSPVAAAAKAAPAFVSASTPTIVAHKFGGSSLADAGRIRHSEYAYEC